jgi:hypothetical protein
MLRKTCRGCETHTADRDIKFAGEHNPVRSGFDVCVGIICHMSNVSTFKAALVH